MDLTKQHVVLDHGYVAYVEHWGSDERIVEAARMSTGKGFLGWDAGECPICEGTGKLLGDCGDSPNIWYDVCIGCGGKGAHAGDSKLLRTLKENNHDTPFEMAGLVIETRAPIFVFREWHRHRTQSYNEHSARYSPLVQLDYMPTVERCMRGGGHLTKQAGAATEVVLTEPAASAWLKRLQSSYDFAEEVYQEGLSIGIPKEIARCPVPVGRYSKMRASAVLRNWLAFLVLRDHPAAQWEIQQYAGLMRDLVAHLWPRTFALFEEQRRHVKRMAQLRKAARGVLNDDAKFKQLLTYATTLAGPNKE